VQRVGLWVTTSRLQEGAARKQRPWQPCRVVLPNILTVNELWVCCESIQQQGQQGLLSACCNLTPFTCMRDHQYKCCLLVGVPVQYLKTIQ
jgi:hypothetical protein